MTMDRFRGSEREGRTEPFVFALARAWVRLYTAGIPADERVGRRAEVESDLWEQQLEDKGGSLTLHVLQRIVLGMAADLSWRFEQAPPLRQAGMAISSHSAVGLSWTVRRGLPGVSLMLAAGYVLIGLLLLLVMSLGGGEKPPSEQAWGAAFLISSGAAIAGGLRVVPQRRKLGLALLLLGTVPFGLFFSATIVVPAASIATLIYGVLRARRRKVTA